MIFRILFSVGFTFQILFNEAAADSSKYIPNGKHIFYSWISASKEPCNDFGNNDTEPECNATSYTDENMTASVLLPNDQNQCQIKETITCDLTYPYRIINGSCNNLAHPTWGISRGCYLRFQPAFYEGYDKFRKSISGTALPKPRDIIVNTFRKVHQLSTTVSFMFTVYGQTVAHDLSRAEIPDLDINCCSTQFFNHTACAAISVRSDDPFFSKFNHTCLFMHRTEMCTDCSDKSREQVNGATSPLDASIVYGSDDDKAMQIRANDGTGKLISNVTENGELLTIDQHAHRLFCPQQKNCFLTGDMRVNQHALLSSMETLYMREHNRVAMKLKELNPHWEEEKLYQEARRMLIATLQCITYKEYLPTLLGPYLMRKFDLDVKNTSDGTTYNPDIHLGVRNEFANACFRLHSMIPREIGSLDLRFKHAYQNPALIINGHMETLTQGASKVPSKKLDNYYVTDAINYLGQYMGVEFGTDLASIDIQRGRDHGLAPYIVMVRFCSEGQVNITTFDDLEPLLMPKDSVKFLKKNYEAVDDIDLYVGMQLETKLPGAEVGPTAACIIALQFYSAKFGDRFYFEHQGEVPSFTEGQRNSIKHCSLSRLLCDNLNIERLQKFPMFLPTSENPEVLCEDIPEINLTYWREIL